MTLFPAAHHPIDVASAALAEGNIEDAVRIILNSWIGILTGPRHTELDAICSRLPHDAAEDPRILAVKACVQDAQGANEMGRILLARAEALADAHHNETSDTRLPGLDWHLGFAQMLLSHERAEVVAAADRVWDMIGEGIELESRSRAAALQLIGGACLRHRSTPERGIQALQFAMRESHALGDTALHDRAARQLSFTLAWAGRIRAARKVLQSINDTAKTTKNRAFNSPWQSNHVGSEQATEAYIAYLSNDVELARHSITRLGADAPYTNSFAGTARFLFVLTAAASREPALMRRATLELQFIPQQDSRGISWASFRRACQAALAEATGHRGRAVTIARSFSKVEDLPLVAVVCAGILRRAGHPEDALGMLQKLERYQQLSYVRVATLATAAVVASRRGNTSTAHELIERALETAEAEDIRRPFCEWDTDLRQLTRSHIAWGTRYAEFIEACLVAHTSAEHLQGLTERERVVLAQLRTTRTYMEIADELGVSVNTIKTQARSVCRKLGVRSRRDAVNMLTAEP